jgi:hypothetical protein
MVPHFFLLANICTATPPIIALCVHRAIGAEDLNFL